MTLDSSGSTSDSEEFATSVNEEVGEASISQYVTFYVGNECFAFPMETVHEIIRVPEVVAVPMTPTALRGLANLRGSVLPLIDLRLALGLEERPLDDASRAVVVDCGRPIGLVVDRVSMVLSIPRDSIEDAASVQSSVKADLLTGVAKDVEGRQLIQIFDAPFLVKSEFGEVVGGGGAATVTGKTSTETQEKEAEENLLQIVSLVVDGQEYAFKLSDVREIVRVPDNISVVPRCDSCVLGLMNLRGGLLPLVALRRIFAMPDAPIEEHNRVLVVAVESDGGDPRSVGVVVDQMRQVLRLHADIVDPMPTILNDEDADGTVSGVCRLDEGKRLVFVLSAAALFGRPDVKAALQDGASDKEAGPMDEQDVELDALDDEEGNETQLVVFQLAGQDYGAPIGVVQEIIRVPDEMNKLPRTPDFVQGMINLRGSVLPVVEMRLRLELERIQSNERQRILVLQVGETNAGFVVDSVSEVLRLGKTSVEDAPSMSDDQRRLMGSIANIDGGKRMIQIVNVDQLLEQHELKALSGAATAPESRNKAA